MAASFRILELIGEGGFGRVYRAWMYGPAGLRKEVALKLIRPDRASDELLERLRAEARILGLLRHEGVVGVEPPVRVGESWVVVLEYVRGVSLDAAIRAGMPEGARLEVIAEVARILAAIHAAAGPDGEHLGLLHRDIKPQNIMIAANGDVKLLDFGIAHAESGERGLTVHGLGGTPGFVAPERLVGRELPAGDIFSLGRTLAAAFDDRDLPVGTSVDASLADLVEEAPTLRVDPALAGVQQLADHMLAFEPTRRPPLDEVERRARALASGLGGPSLRAWAEEALPGLRASLPPDERVGRWIGTRPPTHRPRWPWALLAAVLVAGLAALWWQRQQAEREWDAVAGTSVATVADLREGQVAEGTPLVFRDLVVTALQEDAFFASPRVGKFPWLSGLQVRSSPAGLSIGDRVEVRGRAAGRTLTEVRWVRTGESEPIQPWRIEPGMIDAPPGWEGVLVAVVDAPITEAADGRISLGGGLFAEISDPLPPGGSMHLIAGIATREGDDLVIHPRGPGDLVPEPRVLSVRDLHSGWGAAVGQVVTVTGVITAIGEPASMFFLQDPAGGPGSGAYVWTNPHDLGGLRAGHRVRVTGTLQEWVDRSADRSKPPLPELLFGIDGTGRWEILGEAPVPEPVVIEPSWIATYEDARRWAGMLVRVEWPQPARVAAFDEYYPHWIPEIGLHIGDRLAPFDARLGPGVRLHSVTGTLELAFGRVTIDPRGPQDLVLAE